MTDTERVEELGLFALDNEHRTGRDRQDNNLPGLPKKFCPCTTSLSLVRFFCPDCRVKTDNSPLSFSALCAYDSYVIYSVCLTGLFL